MAKIRIGLGSEFNLKDQKVGLGTNNPQERLDVAGVAKGKDLKVTGISSLTAYEGFLRADQQIAENTTLSFDQGPSASLSGEIIVGTGQTVTVTGVGLGTTTVGVGSFGTGYSGGTITNTIDTTDVTRAGGSEIECLKVYNTFTPPSGGTNERPYAPKPGELYYNYDFKTIEFFDGYGWRQVDNTTRSGRGVWASGYNASGVPANTTSSIDYINIMSLGNSIKFGDLTAAGQDAHGCGSETRGLYGGGFNGNVINYITIASAGNGIDFGDLRTAGANYIGATSSSTRGWWAGGRNAPASTNTNEMSYVTINTLGSSIDAGDLSVQRWTSSGGMGSPTRAIWSGGTPSTKQSTYDVSTIASTGNAIEFGNILHETDYSPGACSNTTKGVFVGQANSLINYSQFITISSGGNAQRFGDLSNKCNGQGGGASTQIRGVFSINLVGSVDTNTLEYITFSTAGNSIDFGDLRGGTGSTWTRHISPVSDSHGGLGGF